jgi:colanic acid biosynthesis protein WcaH
MIAPGSPLACFPIGMQPDREKALAVLESWALDPTAGLPYELFLFVSRLVPMINVDLLISDDRGRVLLTWRDDEIFGAGWHVPGGMIRYKETAEERIRATALDELGAEVAFEGTPFLEQTIDLERRLRGHLVSLVYRCRLTSPLNEAIRFNGGEPVRGQWAWHARWPVNIIAAHGPYRKFLGA